MPLQPGQVKEKKHQRGLRIQRGNGAQEAGVAKAAWRRAGPGGHFGWCSPPSTRSSNFQQATGHSREAGGGPLPFVCKLQRALTLTQTRGQQNNRGLGPICNFDLTLRSLLPTTRSRTGKNRKLGEELPSHLPPGETPTLTSGQGLLCFSQPMTFSATPRKCSFPTCRFGHY